jgi:type II secretory pathway pseudopilin PulG
MGKINSRQAGISLLEILVVLILVSVLVGTVSLSVINRPAHRLQTSVESLRQQIKALKEDAILQSRLYTIVFAENKYTIYALNNDNRLVRLKDDNTLHSGELPEGVDFGEFRLDNEVMPGKARLIIEPSSPLPSFRLAITDHKQTWWLSNRPQDGLRISEQAS